jgi:hypothetical protein
LIAAVSVLIGIFTELELEFVLVAFVAMVVFF